MSTNILGISAFYHDSAAALVRDGEIVAAAQEERFSRKKHDPRFPINAINYCLAEAFIEAGELDAIVGMHTSSVRKVFFESFDSLKDPCICGRWHQILRRIGGDLLRKIYSRKMDPAAFSFGLSKFSGVKLRYDFHSKRLDTGH